MPESRPPAATPENQRPELLSREELVELARALGSAHRLLPEKSRGRALLPRVARGARELESAFRDLTAVAERREPITPAVEWFLDNFHIVEDQISRIRKHLPSTFYGELPKLDGGDLPGLPRVYGLAYSLLEHSDGSLDETCLIEAARVYQLGSALRIGELWAFPIMLRIGLLENLCRLSRSLVSQHRSRIQADLFADELARAGELGPRELAVAQGNLAQAAEKMGLAGLVRLFERLRGRGHRLAPTLEWLTHHVEATFGTSVDDAIRRESHNLASDQISVSNSISSFRLLDRIDWRRFVEETSQVEAILCGDPAGIHAGSDFATRDAARHAVEVIARRAKKSENEVARAAVELAQTGSVDLPPGHEGDRTRFRCVTYYLTDRGRSLLEHKLGCRPAGRDAAIRFARRHSTSVYLGSVGTLVAVQVALAAAAAGPTWGWVAALAALLPASDLAVGLTNWFITRFFPPQVLPRLESQYGVPHGNLTLVAIPTLLTSPSGVDELLERIEIHYLGNHDNEIRFALVTDFTDAATETRESDGALLQRAIDGVEALNQRYRVGEDGAFYLFHRRRLWNEAQGCWMGWERKRGKLMELNRLLRGANDTTFSHVVGEQSLFHRFRFVLCLDTDTHLPPSAAARLIATLAHPLNRPIIDETRRVVTSGHALLQPRVSITLASAGRSIFTRIFSGNVGLDPYTCAVSDAYQDLFGEGIFCGKGIYDIDAFEHVLQDRVSENSLLSHDLYEGSFTRCGLTTDVEFFDEYPAKYNSYTARQHRWIRGDWQLVPWLFPTVRDGRGQRIRNPLSIAARWRVFDNLRRSLVPAGLILYFALAWLALPGAAWQWTVAGTVVVAFPILAHLAGGLMVDPRGVPWTSHLVNLWDDSLTNVKQVLLTFSFLVHQAASSCDAVCRTLWRVFVSRNNLLEWTTAAEAERRLGTQFSGFARRMLSAAIVSVGLLAAILLVRPSSLWCAAPMLLLWLASPALAYWVSLPRVTRKASITAEDEVLLRRIARRTWRFFQDTVTETDHWLPPDNYQEDRPERVAHRTSPTNIGLYLLSVVTAHDLGYVGRVQLVRRLSNTLQEMDNLERYQGHFYNWYDTRAGRPIQPFYVSTVDSGNLAGHLIALKQSCLELAASPLLTPVRFQGLRDTVGCLRDELFPQQAAKARRMVRVHEAGEAPPVAWLDSLYALERLLDTVPNTPAAWHNRAREIHDAATNFQATLLSNPVIAGADALAWADKLQTEVTGLLGDLEAFLSWVDVLMARPPALSPQGGDQISGLLITDDANRLTAEGWSARFDGALAELLVLSQGLSGDNEATAWVDAARKALSYGRSQAQEHCDQLYELAAVADRLALGMDFSFLYDPLRDLFVVGFDTREARPDAYHYDLLASECRLGSYLAIAKGDAPERHWFRLGRAMTPGQDRALISWGGTMFEYLMPDLVMHNYENTLLHQSSEAMVRHQRRFAARARVPWGVSEAGFSSRDQQLNYQYRTFGVPGLALKRDLSDDLVVSPYSTLLALDTAPLDAIRNLEQILQEGGGGRYGMYEAIDYTVSRLPRNQTREVVRSHMAHHQGMGLVAIANLLLGAPMRRRFHADPVVRSLELLLQERSPRTAPTFPQSQQAAASQKIIRELPESAVRHYRSANTATPRVQVLSNGHYSVMVTNAGGGYSRHEGIAITRWREDATRDCWGQFLYLRDAATGEVWSIAHQPCPVSGGVYDVFLSEDKVEFHRVVNRISSHLAIAVSPEDPVEVRRVTLTNTGETVRTLDVVSYAEVVMALPNADTSHPAFQNLFVETECRPELRTLLATRRPRSAHETRRWAFHVLAHDDEPSPVWGPLDWETDRAAFIGRGRTNANPAILEPGSRSRKRGEGAVLDPIFSLQKTVVLQPRESVELTFSTGIAESREGAIHLAQRYHDPRVIARTFELAFTHSQIELRQYGLTPQQARLCQRLASRIIFADSIVRADDDVRSLNRQSQQGLWPHGISGDYPIVLARVTSLEQLPLVRELVVTHEYLRQKGLIWDLIILNEHPPSYIQGFEQALREEAQNEGAVLDHPGGVYIRRTDAMEEPARILLQFVARAIFIGAAGTIKDQLDYRPDRPEPPAIFQPARDALTGQQLPAPDPARRMRNRYGGFSPDGREYVIVLDRQMWTPAPWINVVANSRLGFLASESGLGYTWSENSRENRLTPWSNDPISDNPGEAIYIRNEDTGRIWGLTPLPRRSNNPYVVRHGAGYTSFSLTAHGLEQELTVFAAAREPVKLYRVQLKNISDRPQRVSLTFYAEWVLGVERENNYPFIFTSSEGDAGGLFARNHYNTEFGERVAFVNVSQSERNWTCDRTEFLGRNGSTYSPRALRRLRLSGASGGSFDPCAALQAPLTLAPGSQTVLYFCLGQGVDAAEARALAAKYRVTAAGETALAEARASWRTMLDNVQVSTPEPWFDALMNQWLLYQVLSCRVWGRSALYQSGGAFGFRDQLQDVMALVTGGGDAGRKIARDQILLHASRQFPEGDVQHWWHPPAGRGIRTRFSDDLLWLPYVTAFYVRTSGDGSILDVDAPFIQGRLLNEGEDEYYDLPVEASESASLYEHCLRALRKGMTQGEHGLPLFGTGDWNDGMSAVGREGRGESVWVAWFLLATINDFLPICRERGDLATVDELEKAAERYRRAVETHAWDGNWYLRAFFDDGSPMGSSRSEECKIDAIAQSWAVISGAGDPIRGRHAMDSVIEHLVRSDDRILLLFTPPFDKSDQDPGYIKGYVPGVRENGGQYTHAALWTVLATALLGRGSEAFRLFSLISPVRHALDRVDTYKVEPYVVAADVYGEPPHTGRGGWTWYTGSASWMYRIGIETILGIRAEGNSVRVDPCIPAAWKGYEVVYRHEHARYKIQVKNPNQVERGVLSVSVDGVLQPGTRFPLDATTGDHTVEVVLGTRPD